MLRKYKPAILFVLSIVATLAITHSPSLQATPACTQESSQIKTKTESRSAQLFENLGNYNFPVSTNNPLAQRYVDQGLILAYGFNHAEAARSFQEAARLDPNCAMCYWGLAYVLGPNINAAMEDEAVPTAYEAIQKAIALQDYATEREQAYIWAMAKRYTPKPVEDRSKLELAYANAMGEVAQKYPDDLDAQTIFVEALMDTMPWDYWLEDGSPKPETVEMMNTLESVFDRNPNHVGALHLYIHVVEKERPELGLEAANRLRDLVPGAGHLAHMPSHIYIRTGRYHDAVLSNQQAIQADDAYLSENQAEGIYPLAYKPHNHHFLWFAALMSGQSKIALEAAEQTAKVDPKLLEEGDLAGALQHYSTIPLFTQTRFSRWDEILATPAPAQRYPKAIWHYSRGMAFLGKRQPTRAAQELKELQAIADDPALKDLKIWGFNSTASILEIATQVLSGELAAQTQQYEQAIAHLKTAVKLEDALVYTEPPDWYQPTRQALAKVLLKAGKAQEAEQVYRADLNIYPDNGWSLYGLAQSLQAQGKTQEAQSIQTQFQTAWEHADISLTAAQF
jgi:tetratricopeptide (TPR) repeat protein